MKNAPCIKAFCFSVIVLVLTACGATHSRKPLGEGRSQIHMSVGGPLITVGAPIPAPYSSVGYAYGFSDRINFHANLHTTAAAYKVFASEVGAGFGLLKQDGYIPELYLDLRGAFATNAEDTVFYPIISPVASYEVAWWNPYVGIDMLFQFHDNDRIYTPQIWAPFVGSAFQVFSKWQAGLEVKWAAPNHDMRYVSVDHPASAFGTRRGALAPHLFISYQFGGSKE